MSIYRHHIMTNDGVMIIFDDRTIAVTKEMKYFKETKNVVCQ